MTNRLCVVLALVVTGAIVLPSAGEDPRPYAGKVFLGLRTKVAKLPANPRVKSAYGLRVMRVAARSAADKAGLRIGDIIVGIGEITWAGPKISLRELFYPKGPDIPVGRAYKLHVARLDARGKPGKLTTLDLVLTRYPRTVQERPGAPTNDQLRPDLAGVRSPQERLCWELIREAGLVADCNDLLARLRRCEEFPDPDRLAIVRYVHRDPFKVEPVTREICAPIVRRPGRGLADLSLLLGQAERALLRFDRRRRGPVAAPASRPALPEYKGKSLAAHLDYIAAVLEAAARLHQKAFAALGPDDLKYILDHRAGMFESFLKYKMLSYEPDQARQRASAKVMDLAGKVDLSALAGQARLASLLVAPKFIASLRAAAAASKKDLSAGTIAGRQTPHGSILIAGTGPDAHTGRDYAVLYDLGGDDHYRNNQGASVPPAIPTAVLVDCAGDDAYETTRLLTQGAGNLGVGLLVDLAGDDSYAGLRFTQGVAFLGVGVLIDEAGDDVYRGLDLHQGVGHWGIGLLVDRAGRDRYEAKVASQAVGLPGGLGMLYDGGGDDSYYCKGKQQSGYGTKGVFEGWGQGMGMGYRVYASGGVGVLIDGAGADTFEAGNFSQGGGYYYGFGILYSAGAGDDRYIGSRYAQGFGCHQAVGALIDEGGNDRYTNRYGGVAQGFSWDEAVALFIDQAGNDRYGGRFLCQGASAMNGWSIFIDGGGTDIYRYGNPARTSGNHYHGGTSLSFFVDVGGAKDYYSAKPNNAVRTGGERFLFVDLPGTITDALKAGAYKKLMRPPPAKATRK